MKIIRVEGNIVMGSGRMMWDRRVWESTVDGKRVGKLPKGLRRLVVKLLNHFPGVKTIEVAERIEHAILEKRDRNIPVSSLGKNLQKESLETLGLLRWYLKPHWYSNVPEAIGGDAHCADCHISRPSGHGLYCPNPRCPSHKKWRKVLGPSYKVPEDPTRRWLEKEVFPEMRRTRV